MWGARYQRPVILTRHAQQRMQERRIDLALVLRMIDEGSTRHADPTRLWSWLHVPGREDHLFCAVRVLEDGVVVKTVMNRWEPTT